MTTPTTHKLTVRGMKVITRTPRRYAVVTLRTEPVVTETGTYVPFIRVEKRTDSLVIAKRAKGAFGIYRGAIAVVVDLTTGEEV